MHHCVATYVDRVAEKKTVILFLRRRSDPETPFYTIEIDADAKKTAQCRAKYNGTMTPEVKRFIEKYEKHLQEPAGAERKAE